MKFKQLATNEKISIDERRKQVFIEWTSEQKVFFQQ